MAPNTRMFRDRVVSMEQTLERGEKHLELLKALCADVFPEFVYREHVLDHEKDLFVIILETPDGRRKAIGWTRMVLFDAERLPALLEDPSSPLGAKLKQYLREREARPEIIVTFRHLEEGWVDTPEPKREKRRRRRGRHGERRDADRGRERGQPPPRPGPAPRPPQAAPARPPAPADGPTASGPAAGAGEAQRRRRRRSRRRRGRGGAPPTQGSAGSPPASGKT